jgi:hypothetical protein
VVAAVAMADHGSTEEPVVVVIKAVQKLQQLPLIGAKGATAMGQVP